MRTREKERDCRRVHFCTFKFKERESEKAKDCMREREMVVLSEALSFPKFRVMPVMVVGLVLAGFELSAKKTRLTLMLYFHSE